MIKNAPQNELFLFPLKIEWLTPYYCGTVCIVGQIALSKYEGATPVSGFHIAAELVGMNCLCFCLLHKKIHLLAMTMCGFWLKCVEKEICELSASIVFIMI